MASDGSSIILAGSLNNDPGQPWMLIFGALLLMSAATAGAAGLVERLRDPMSETNKAERRDARALRKENSMSMQARLAAIELAKRKCQKYFSRYHTEPRHARPEGQPPSEILRAAVLRRRAAECKRPHVRPQSN